MYVETPTIPYVLLPWELVWRIVSIAAAASRHSALQLCLTAQWANHIARPYLLDTVVLKDTQQLYTFSTQLTVEVPRKASRASLVRHAWMGSLLDASEMVTLIYLCKGLKHIAVSSRSFPILVVSTTVFTPSTQLLSLSHDVHLTLFDTITHPAWFAGFLAINRDKESLLSHITHLRLIETGAYRDCMPIKYYPRLSHLMLPYRGVATHELPELMRFLSKTSLQVLAIEIVPDALSTDDMEYLKHWIELMRITGKRVQVVFRVSDDIQNDWEHEMRGGEDIWERATRHPLSLQDSDELSILFESLFALP